MATLENLHTYLQHNTEEWMGESDRLCVVWDWKNEELDNLWSKVTPICDNKFKKVMIGQTEHIWKAFKSLFGGGN